MWTILQELGFVVGVSYCFMVALLQIVVVLYFFLSSSDWDGQKPSAYLCDGSVGDVAAAQTERTSLITCGP